MLDLAESTIYGLHIVRGRTDKILRFLTALEEYLWIAAGQPHLNTAFTAGTFDKFVITPLSIINSRRFQKLLSLRRVTIRTVEISRLILIKNNKY